MNLSMSVIGFFHTLACILALGVGVWLMVGRKGTPRHRRWGDIYTGAILFASVSSLTIYTRHAFTAAHWFGVIAILLSAGGFALGRWHGKGNAWKYGHIFCMVGSYYVLVGGGVNEVFLRVNTLRPIFRTQPQVVGEVHGLAILTFLLLIIAFMAATAISAFRFNRRLNARLSAKAA
ncbi:MAG TPA: hypothetical protein VHN39_07565 [Phenylobacterium sp.]|jgi:uncharacterized membrane protein|nr:hypothetical protein [Phenylobacterium sp.]